MSREMASKDRELEKVKFEKQCLESRIILIEKQGRVVFKELDYSVSQVNLSRADISVIQTSPSKAQNLNVTNPGNQTAADIGNLVEPLADPAPMDDPHQDGKYIAGLDEQIENAAIVIR